MGSFSFVISYDLCDNYYYPLLLVSHAYKGPKDQCEKDSEKMCLKVFSFVLGSNSPCVESVYSLRSSYVQLQAVPFIVGSYSHGFNTHKLYWQAFWGYLWLGAKKTIG